MLYFLSCVSSQTPVGVGQGLASGLTAWRSTSCGAPGHEATVFCVNHWSWTFDCGREQHVPLLNETAYVGVTGFRCLLCVSTTVNSNFVYSSTWPAQRAWSA